MKIYIASPWAERERMPQIATELEAMGHTITHKWWKVEGIDNEDRTPSTMRVHGELDANGVVESDLVLLINSSKSEGKAVEQGIAIALGKPILTIGKLGEFSQNVFHYLNLYKWVDTIEDAYVVLSTISWLLKEDN